MYYVHQAILFNQAALPRILAEDTGAAELRDPIALEKTAFKFRKPSWLCRVRHTPALCSCHRPCSASC